MGVSTATVSRSVRALTARTSTGRAGAYAAPWRAITCATARPYLGNSRIGPDLSDIGVRRDKAGWYYQHFYDPDAVSPGTNCPPLRFLFDHHRIAGQPSTDAVKISDNEPAVPTVETVPRHDAKALAAYLLSLKRTSYKLAEAPTRLRRTPDIYGETDSTCRRFGGKSPTRLPIRR